MTEDEWGARAYLVRKPIQHLDETLPVHILLLDVGGTTRSRGL